MAERLLSRAAIAAICVALFTPLVVTTGTLFPYVAGKGVAVRLATEAAVLLYAALVVVQPDYRPRATPIAIAVLTYVLVGALAAMLGVDPYHSVFGNLERMEGWIGLAHGVALFVVAAAVLRSRAQWLLVLEASLLASVVVAALAFVPPDTPPPGYRPGSTLGHPDFLATYALFHVFFTVVVVAWEPARWRRALALVAGVLNIAALMVAASRGAMVGLYAAIVAGALLWAWRGSRRRAAIAVLAALIAAPFAVRALDGTAIVDAMPHAIQRLARTTLDDPSTQTRIRSLRICLAATAARPLLGYGPDNFRAAFDRHFDPSDLGLEQWFDRAHDKPAEVMVETGLMGLAAHLAIFVIAGVALLRRVRSPRDACEPLVAGATLCAGVAYFVQNLFLFDTPSSLLLFFLTLALASFVAETRAVAASSRRVLHKVALAVTVPTVVALAILVNVLPLEAASLGRIAATAASEAEALAAYRAAMERGGFARDEVTRSAMDAYIESGRARAGAWPAMWAELRAQSQAQVARGPSDVRALMRVANLYNERSIVEPGLRADAERVSRAAIALSPSRPDAYYELGVTYLRGGDYGDAARTFRRALSLNERNTWARWGLGLALMAGGRDAEARPLIDDVLRGGAGWDHEPELYLLTQAYVTTLPSARVAALYERVTQAYPVVARYRVAFAIALAKAGRSDEARMHAERAAELDPTLAAGASEFIAGLPR